MADQATRREFRFAEFELHVASGRLLRDGRAVPLQRMPFELLALLLEAGGEVVTRERIRVRLWPDGSHVDFEHSVNTALKKLRRALGDDAERPRFIETIPKRGYRWLTEARAAKGPSAFARLPTRSVRLIGRDAELDALEATRREARLVTIAGPGGSGKTALACALARRESASGATYVWVDLSRAEGALDCARLLAESLTLGERDEGALERALAQAIGERALTLLVDNCDRVAPHVAQLASGLLARCPRLSILCTSQRILDTPEETVSWLAPLRVPDDAWRRAADPPARLLDFASVELLCARARAVAPSFGVDARNAAAIAELCRRLDGLPLALELAAARLAAISPAQLCAALEDRFTLLARRSAPEGGRQRSLQAAIEWSYGLLDETESGVLDRLGVFAGSFSSEAAHAVAGPPAASRAEVENFVQGLAQKSLLVVERHSSACRYSLLDSVATFARARLEATGTFVGARRRHAEYFAGFVARAGAELLGPDQLGWHGQLIADWPNVQAAFAWARESPSQRAAAGAIVAGLRFFWGERVQSLEKVHTLAPEGPSLERARFFNGVAWIELFSERPVGARSAARDAEREAALAGDDWEAAYALAVQAWSAALEGDADAARRLGPRAIRAAERARAPWLLALAHLGPLFLALDERARAAALAEAQQVLEYATRARDLFLTRFARTYVGFTQYLSGDLEAARATYLPLAESMREISSLRAKAPMLEIASYLAIGDGRADRCAQLLAAAERLREATGAPLLRPWIAPHDDAVSAARAALGEVDFRSAWNLGRRSEADDALRWAIEVLAGASRPVSGSLADSEGSRHTPLAS